MYWHLISLLVRFIHCKIFVNHRFLYGMAVRQSHRRPRFHFLPNKKSVGSLSVKVRRSDIVAKDGNTDSNDDPHRGDNVFKPAALVFPDHGNAAKAAPFLYDNKMIFPADTRSE